MFFYTTFVYPLKVPNITIISEKNSLGNTWDHSGDIGNLLSLFTIIQQGGGIIEECWLSRKATVYSLSGGIIQSTLCRCSNGSLSFETDFLAQEFSIILIERFHGKLPPLL